MWPILMQAPLLTWSRRGSCDLLRRIKSGIAAIIWVFICALDQIKLWVLARISVFLDILSTRKEGLVLSGGVLGTQVRQIVLLSVLIVMVLILVLRLHTWSLVDVNVGIEHWALTNFSSYFRCSSNESIINVLRWFCFVKLILSVQIYQTILFVGRFKGEQMLIFAIIIKSALCYFFWSSTLLVVSEGLSNFRLPIYFTLLVEVWRL